MTEAQHYHWVGGNAPACCTGNCRIGGVTESSCGACGWQESEPDYPADRTGQSTLFQ